MFYYDIDELLFDTVTQEKDIKKKLAKPRVPADFVSSDTNEKLP